MCTSCNPHWLLWSWMPPLDSKRRHCSLSVQQRLIQWWTQHGRSKFWIHGTNHSNYVFMILWCKAKVGSARRIIELIREYINKSPDWSSICKVEITVNSVNIDFCLIWADVAGFTLLSSVIPHMLAYTINNYKTVIICKPTRMFGCCFLFSFQQAHICMLWLLVICLQKLTHPALHDTCWRWCQCCLTSEKRFVLSYKLEHCACTECPEVIMTFCR